MQNDILYFNDDYIFSYRIAGVLVRDGKILLQKPKDDDYSLIGGHVSAFEATADTLKREFKEEIGADISVGSLIGVGEIFFNWGKKPCHQISLYYKVSLCDESQIPLDGVFSGYDDFGNTRIDLDFCWVTLEEFEKAVVYPLEMKEHILSRSDGVYHFVCRDL